MSGWPGLEGWIAKARQDARSARRLLADPPELEDAAYHTHQAIEKALKAILVAAAIRHPRGRGAGHDLGLLAGLVPVGNPLHTRAQSMTALTPWATAFRYPADDPATAPAPPLREEIERHLGEAETFIDAVAAQATWLCSGSASEPED